MCQFTSLLTEHFDSVFETRLFRAAAIYEFGAYSILHVGHDARTVSLLEY